MKASKADVEKIHGQITRAYLRLLEKIDPESEFYDKDYSPNPALLGHINKFLAQNDVTAVPVPDSPLDRLKKAGKLSSLPFLTDKEKVMLNER